MASLPDPPSPPKTIRLNASVAQNERHVIEEKESERGLKEERELGWKRMGETVLCVCDRVSERSSERGRKEERKRLSEGQLNIYGNRDLVRRIQRSRSFIVS